MRGGGVVGVGGVVVLFFCFLVMKEGFRVGSDDLRAGDELEVIHKLLFVVAAHIVFSEVERPIHGIEQEFLPTAHLEGLLLLCLPSSSPFSLCF